jgi:hypothetical protein
MCIIIDTCAIACVFDKANKSHEAFKPVYDWIMVGKGKMVYGGTKYGKEIGEMKRYIKFIAQLEKKGKVVILPKNSVDEYEVLVKNMENNPDFDDPHLIAMVLVSRCKLICTAEERAKKYITDKKFYGNGVKVPCIYSSNGNKDLLSDKYMSKVCDKPKKLSKKDVIQIVNSII